jgi:hypothetical protein
MSEPRLESAALQTSVLHRCLLAAIAEQMNLRRGQGRRRVNHFAAQCSLGKPLEYSLAGSECFLSFAPNRHFANLGMYVR